MRQDSLSKHFEAIGARVKFRPLERPRWPRNGPLAPYTIDIKRDSHGPFFDFGLTDKAPEFEVLQVVPKERHLLLFTVMGRLKPATRGRIKTGHLRSSELYLFPEGGSRYGEWTEDGCKTCGYRALGARVVAPPDRPGASGTPGDGCAVRSAAEIETGHFDPRLGLIAGASLRAQERV